MESADTGRKRYPITGKVLVNTRKLTRNWHPGTKIACSFVLRKFRNFRNEGAFDYTKYMKEKGFIGKTFIPSDMFVISLKNNTNPWNMTVSYIRNQAFNFLMKKVPNPENTIYAALLLGMRKLLPDYVREAFNTAGVSHLLAISGLHLGLLGGILYFLFSFLFSSWEWALLKFDRTRLALLATIPFIIFYAELTGLSLPTKRALLMVLITLAALLTRKQKDFWQILAMAALLILADQPHAVFLPSFQLSFSALVAIMYLTPRLKKLLRCTTIKTRFRVLNAALDLAFVSLSATIGVAPLIALHFHTVSLLGIIANLFVIPLVGFVSLPCGLLSITASLVDPSLASAIIWPGTQALHLAVALTLKLSHFSFGLFYLPDFDVKLLVLTYILIFLLFSSTATRWKIIGMGSIVVVLLGLTQITSRKPIELLKNRLQMTVLDVGFGCSGYVRFPSGHNMLIEGGNYTWSTFDIGKHVVAPFLWKNHVRSIDYLLLASIYPRCTSLPFVARAFDIKEVWHIGVGLRGYAFKESFNLFKKAHCKKRMLSDFKNIRIGPVGIRVLSPASSKEVRWCSEPPYYKDLNLAMEIRYGNTRIVLCPSDLPSRKVEKLGDKCRSTLKTALIFYARKPEEKTVRKIISLFKPDEVIFSPSEPKSFQEKVLPGLTTRWFSPRRDGMIQIESNGKQISVRVLPSAR